MFTPRRRRFMTLSVIASALAADRFRKGNPFAVHAPDRLLAMAATDADHHDEGRDIADAANHQGLPADAVDEEERAGAGAEGERQDLEHIELGLAPQLRQANGAETPLRLFTHDKPLLPDRKSKRLNSSHVSESRIPA